MRGNKGFTLMEVLVGTAVLAMMAFLIWSITATNLSSEERSRLRDEVYQKARLAIRMMTDDLSMAFLVANQDLLGKTGDGSNSVSSFIGNEKGGFPSVNFNSFSHLRLFREVKESDQAEVGYYVEADPELKDVYRLMRRESPVIDKNTAEGGDANVVTDGLIKFELEYYNSRTEDWTTDWNTQEVDYKDRLPRAVKIKIVFPDPNNDEETISFETIAFISLWKNPIEF